MSIKQISVFMENRPGMLLAMTKELADHNIDIRGMSLAETKDFGIVRLIIADVYEAATVLKEAGYVYSLAPVLSVAIPDTPKGLCSVLEVLEASGVNIEYMYAFPGGEPSHTAYMIFRVEEPAVAGAALAAKGFRILDIEDL